MSNAPIKALWLIVQIEAAIKDDISIFAYSIRQSKVAVQTIRMIQDQAADNLQAMEKMFGAELINKILDYGQI